MVVKSFNVINMIQNTDTYIYTVLIRNSGTLCFFFSCTFHLYFSKRKYSTYSMPFILFRTVNIRYRHQIKKTSAHWFIFNSLNSILAFSISTHPHIYPLFLIYNMLKSYSKPATIEKRKVIKSVSYKNNVEINVHFLKKFELFSRYSSELAHSLKLLYMHRMCI